MPAEKFLRHIVLFTFNDEASLEQIDEVGKAFLALHSQIGAVHDIEWGSAINEPEPYTHC